MASVRYIYGRRITTLDQFDFKNKIFEVDSMHEEEVQITKNIVKELYPTYINSLGRSMNSVASEKAVISLDTFNHALPDWNTDINLDEDEYDNYTTAQKLKEENYIDLKVLSCLMTQYIHGPGEHVKSLLKDLRYIGPIRKAIPRNYQHQETDSPGRWADGLAAWDTLFEEGASFVEEVGDWFGNKNLLNSGYSLDLSEYYEVDCNQKLIDDLRKGKFTKKTMVNDALELFASLPRKKKLSLIKNNTEKKLCPSDVGEGISQVLPVVVACLDYHSGILSIEQPELHLHPEMQARLADIFIHRIHSYGVSKPIVLLETHSEHLILRLLKRIRQTAKNKDQLYELQPNELSICYIDTKNGQAVVEKIEIDDMGDFLTPWPDNFFDLDFMERFGND